MIFILNITSHTNHAGQDSTRSIIYIKTLMLRGEVQSKNINFHLGDYTP